MKVFVDTSALYALMAPEDAHHASAVTCFTFLDDTAVELISTNYILLECASLIQRRHGFAPAQAFLARAAKMLDLVWIGPQEHQQAVTLWTAERRRSLSVVDCSTMAVMRQHGLHDIVAFDAQFAQAGFHVLPQPDRVAERAGVYRVRRPSVHAKAH